MTALEQKLLTALENEQNEKEKEQKALLALMQSLLDELKIVSSQQSKIIELLQKEGEGENFSKQLSKILAPLFMSLQLNLKEELGTLLKKP